MLDIDWISSLDGRTISDTCTVDSIKADAYSIVIISITIFAHTLVIK